MSNASTETLDLRLFTVRQLAQRIGVRETQVRYWLECGLPHRRRGGVFIKLADYERWEEESRRIQVKVKKS